MSSRAQFQIACFVLQTVFGGLVTIFANWVMNTGSMVSAASVVASSLLTLLCMGFLELTLDVAMDVVGEPRLVAVRRFTGRPRDVVVNALLTGTGIVLISYSLRTDRTPLPLQVMIQLLMNLLIAPAKVALVQFKDTLPLFQRFRRSTTIEHTPRAQADAREFWVQYSRACMAFITATVLTSMDRSRALAVTHRDDGGSPSTMSLFALVYTVGVLLMSLAQIHADATLSGAEQIAAQLTRRSTQPSRLELMKQGLNFGTTKQFWRLAVSMLMIPASLYVPGLDTADVVVDEASIRHTFFAIFSLRSASVIAFVVVLTLQAFLEPLINAEDASLNAASQNTQSVLLIALAWIPSLTDVTAGYVPSVALTLPALILVALGSVPLARFSAIVQRYHHGEIATAPNEEEALRLVEQAVATRGSRPGSLWDLHHEDTAEGADADARSHAHAERLPLQRKRLPSFGSRSEGERSLATRHPIATTGLGMTSRMMSPSVSRSSLADPAWR